jgi:hypothetical protein
MEQKIEDIDFDNATEEELSQLRGDYVGEENVSSEVAEEAPDEEAPAESEDEQGDQQAETTDESVRSEEVSEEAPEPEDVAPEAPKQESFMIPKSRYDAVMKRLKDLEASVEQPAVNTESTAAPSETPSLEAQFADIDKKIAEAVRDGDGEEAAKLMRQSRDLQSELFQQQVQQQTAETSQSTLHQIRYDQFVDVVEQLIPEADPNGAAYDEGFVLEVSELKEAFEAKGHSQTVALSKALNYVKPGWDSPRRLRMKIKVTVKSKPKLKVRLSKRNAPNLRLVKPT